LTELGLDTEQTLNAVSKYTDDITDEAVSAYVEARLAAELL